jgi:O-antigen biosynthesis protein
MISIVIPLYNRWDLTRNCLDALTTSTPEPFELVMVDNGSTDGSAAQRCHVRNLRNRGFAVACNQGAQYAEGDIVVFLNNDTLPQLGWLAPLVAPLEDGTAGITGARLTYEDGTIQHAGVDVNLSRSFGDEARNILTDEPSGSRDAVTGACLAIRREDFIRLGQFDTGYWNGYEDVDLCLTALAHGLDVRYVAESTVIHLESQSGAERFSGFAKNVQRLRDKWGSK